MKALVLGGILVGVAAALQVAPGGGATDPALESYRSWTRLTPDAVLVPYRLAIQCARVTDAQVEAERKTHGPHTNRWIRVYANPLAESALADARVTVFPAGAMIAKEKLRDPGDAHPEGVAFMIKRPQGQFPRSDGWEFVYTPAADSGSYDGCIACHRAGGRKDYVFGRYDRDGVR